MTDLPDLPELLAHPALALEPPPALLSAVRERARRHRRRRRAAAGALAAGAVVGVALGVGAAPGLPSRESVVQPALPQVDERAPDATTDVVALRELNGGTVLTWWEERLWCAGVYRARTRTSCAGPVSLGPGLTEVQPALRIDERVVAAGTVGPAVARVVVELTDGRRVAAELVDGRGTFPQRVWSAELPAPARAYVGYDAAGTEVARRAP